MRSPCLALLALTLAGVAQAAYWNARLPVRVASHFGLSGRADGFMSREASLLLGVAVIGGTGLLFAALPPYLRRTSGRTMNLPHKAYWLAPERRESTLDALARWMAWFGVGTQLLVLAAFELSYRANVAALAPETARLQGSLFWTLLALYTIGTLVWIIALLRRFSLPFNSAEEHKLEA